jgi:hypothetical protein
MIMNMEDEMIFDDDDFGFEEDVQQEEEPVE